MIDTVLFDLDGTLADSFEGIADSILYALERLNVPAPPRESLKSFVGPPLYDEFRRRFAMDDGTAREAVRLYREYYPQKGIYRQTPMKGAEELLKRLKTLGITLCLATSKPQEYAEKILELFGFENYIDCVIGATFDGKLSAKADIVALALKKTGAKPETVLMVGDRFYDVDGAHACGVRCVGVLCGFGSREELEESGADYIAEELLGVADIVQSDSV